MWFRRHIKNARPLTKTLVGSYAVLSTLPLIMIHAAMSTPSKSLLNYVWLSVNAIMLLYILGLSVVVPIIVTLIYKKFNCNNDEAIIKSAYLKNIFLIREK